LPARTSVSIEDAFWSGLKEIASERDMTLGALLAAIDADSRTCQSIVGYSTFCAWRLSRSASLKRMDAPIFAGRSASTLAIGR
jgi:predicted DNA-binding ribbon-helix-helix protein